MNPKVLIRKGYNCALGKKFAPSVKRKKIIRTTLKTSQMVVPTLVKPKVPMVPSKDYWDFG